MLRSRSVALALLALISTPACAQFISVTAGGVPLASFFQPATDVHVIGSKAEYTF